jgi:hypothetical protein
LPIGSAPALNGNEEKSGYSQLRLVVGADSTMVPALRLWQEGVKKSGTANRT